MPENSNPPKGHDSYDDIERRDPLVPRNLKKKPASPTAVAVKNAAHRDEKKRPKPVITAAGREKLAERILNLAFENGVRVREDKALAEILAAIEIDSPVPEDAFLAVAEILSKVYQANGQDDPFDAILNPEPDTMTKNSDQESEESSRQKDVDLKKK